MNTLTERAVKAAQRQADEISGYAKRAGDEVVTWTNMVTEVEEQRKLLEEIGTVLSAMETAWRKGFEGALTSMVSRGLTLVLGEPTQFVIRSKQRAGTPSLTFQLEQNGLELDIMEAKGGTLVNLVNFLLRLAVVLAAQPPLRKVLILDEAFAHVSAEYVPALADLLRQLCDETGVQFILVTHDTAYTDAADIVYEVTQKHGVSTYEKIKERRDVL